MRTIWKSFGVTTAMLLITGTALAQTSSTQGAGGVGSSGTDQQPKESTRPDPNAIHERDKQTRSTTEMRSPGVRQAKMSHRAKMAQGDTRAAQEALRTKGFDPGPIDGKLGPRTAHALRDYQKQEGLQQTGRLDGETRTKLGV